MSLFEMKKMLINTDKRGARYLLLCLGGVLTGLTLVFPEIGLLEWIALVPAALAMIGMVRSDITLPRAYGYGMFFFMCFYTVNFHWFIYLYPLEFTGMNRAAAVVVVLAGCLGLSFLQAIVGGLLFAFTVFIGRLSAVRRHPIILPFLAAALWVVHEWGQTLFWSGVPWGRLAIGQTSMPVMIQISSLFGSYAVTFLLVAVNFCLALAICDAKPRRIAAICAVSLIIFNVAAGAVMLRIAEASEDDGELRVALIQGNIASGDKWGMTTSEILDVYESYTLEAAKENPDIIVWPETAVPTVYDSGTKTANRLSELAEECGVSIIVGILTEDDEGREYNSLMLFMSDGSVSEDIYSKRHLVPFGEFLPMRGLITTVIPPLAEIAMLEDDLTPGADSGIISYDGVSYGSLICFDSIYEELTRESVLDGAEVIVISTNDSWFYDSAAGRMHNAQAKLRAVESGRYVLRAANTGISSVITPTGVITDYLPALVGGVIVADVGVRDSLTLYMRTGNVFVAASASFCFAGVLLAAYELIIKKRGSRATGLVKSSAGANK